MISPEFGLEDHFSTIVRMLIQGEVDNYEMVMESEVNRFERFLKNRKINYVKSTSFERMTPSYFFEIPDRPKHKRINPPFKLLEEAVKRYGEGIGVMNWEYTGDMPSFGFDVTAIMCPETHKNMWAQVARTGEPSEDRVTAVRLTKFETTDTSYFYSPCGQCGQVHWCYSPKES
jgi:hypothetical protein